MTSSVDEPFVFEFTEFTFVDKGEFSELPELRILGQITKGHITRELPIVVPTVDGLLTGTIAQFMDRLDDWWSLPFYNKLVPDTIPLCLCIIGIPPKVSLICPGTAYLALEET
jgi:hypothetical protein